ncbi:oligosaccharide flippase family protein [Streptomyces wuyuanensis]|uniref:oligosaccharide flippase family protein n=1 Tax=Streptomyces wuyuanensis TaxID=1196353 RepID=UPI003448E070
MTINSDSAWGGKSANPRATISGERPYAQVVLTGTLWNYAASIVVALLQLGYTAYTGRAVSAADFGAFASALSTTQLLGYFANAGLATTVLRSPELTRSLLMATLRLGVLSGLVCLVVVESTAPFWAELWNAPDAEGLLQLLGLQFLFLPLGAVSTAGLRRLLAQRAAVLVETGSQAAGLLVGTLLLAAGWNPMGLAATSVTTQLGIAVLAAALLAGRLPPTSLPPVERRIGFRELASSSGLLAGHQLAQYLTNTMPLWAAGMLLGPVAAGYYSRATLFTGLLLTMLAAGLTRVTTPALTRVRVGALKADELVNTRALRAYEPPAVRRAVTDVLLAGSALSFLPFGLLAGLGPGALEMLLGPGWTEAAQLVPVLSAFSAAAVLYAVGLSVDTVCGCLRRMAIAQTAAAVTTLAWAIAGTVGRSVTMLAWSALAGQLAGLAVQLWMWRSGRVVEASRLWAGYAVHAILGTTTYAAGVAFSRVADSGLSAPTLFVLLVVALVVAGCHSMRRRLPLYQIAVARGLLPVRFLCRSSGRHRGQVTPPKVP